MTELVITPPADGPLVSVIIPLYNAQKYLSAAFASVVVQTYRPLEIIIVDDGSTDESQRIAHELAASAPFRVEVLSQANSGTSAARNAGVRASNGPILAFLDADDLWLSNKLQLQLQALLEGEYEMVCTLTEQFRSEELGGDAPKTAPMNNGSSSTLITRAAFERVGEFDENCQVEWIEWSIRAQEHQLRTHSISQVLTRRRLHQTNKGRDPQAEVERLKIIGAALKRRRHLSA